MEQCSLPEYKRWYVLADYGKHTCNPANKPQNTNFHTICTENVKLMRKS